MLPQENAAHDGQCDERIQGKRQRRFPRRRGHRDTNRSAVVVPGAVTVGGRHFKCVGARIQVGIGYPATVTDLHPVLVKAFESIAVSVLARIDVVKCRKLKRNHIVAVVQGQLGHLIVGLIQRRRLIKLLDRRHHNGGRFVAMRQRLRIKHVDAVGATEIEPTACIPMVRPKVEFITLQAVTAVIHPHGAGCRIKLRQPVLAADPKTAVGIRLHAVNGISRQAVNLTAISEANIAGRCVRINDPIKSAVGRPHPDVAIVVDMQRVDTIGGQRRGDRRIMP